MNLISNMNDAKLKVDDRCEHILKIEKSVLIQFNINMENLYKFSEINSFEIGFNGNIVIINAFGDDEYTDDIILHIPLHLFEDGTNDQIEKFFRDKWKDTIDMTNKSSTYTKYSPLVNFKLSELESYITVVKKFYNSDQITHNQLIDIVESI